MSNIPFSGYIGSFADPIAGLMPLAIGSTIWWLVRRTLRTWPSAKWAPVAGDIVTVAFTVAWGSWMLSRTASSWAVWALVLGVMVLCTVAWGIYGYWRTKKTGSPVFNMPELAPAGLFALFWLWPQAFQFIFYRVLWLGLPYLLSAALLTAVLWSYFKLTRARNSASPEASPSAKYTWGLLAFRGARFTAKWTVLVVIPLLPALFQFGPVYAWRTYEAFSFEEIPRPIPMSESDMRVESLEGASWILHSRLNASEARIDPEDVHPTAVQNDDGSIGTGYVGLMRPSNWLANLQYGNKGFALLKEGRGTQTEPEIIEQSFAVGQHMWWPRNVYWNLYRHDPFVSYGELTYTTLQGGKPNEWVLMAPKIGYHFRFPTFIRVWAGVALVYPDGHIESLTPEQIRSDSRFKGRVPFPLELHQEYVLSHRYNGGWDTFPFTGPLSNHAGRRGLIEIPRAPGTNQYPIVMLGKDGDHYLVSPVEPDGEAFGLFATFYTNARTGKHSVRWFGEKSSVVGPIYAMHLVETKFKNAGWVDGDTLHRLTLEMEAAEVEPEKRDPRNAPKMPEVRFAMVEAKPFTRGPNDNVYYLINVISSRRTPAVEVYVVDAQNEGVAQFNNRHTFYEWLNDEQAPLPRQ